MALVPRGIARATPRRKDARENADTAIAFASSFAPLRLSVTQMLRVGGHTKVPFPCGARRTWNRL